MAKETKKLGFWKSFMLKYESYTGKKVVNCVYCLGAAVVIFGALCKIMHFSFAGPFLMTGMITEALLFTIGCLDKPHAEYHWQNVFPQLVGYGADPAELEELANKPRPTLLGMGSEGGATVAAPVAATATEAKKANVPSLSDKDLEALKGSISDLANTASQLSELGKIADKTNKLGEKMDAAGAAADKFIGSAEGITASGATLTKSMNAVAQAFDKKNEDLTNAYSNLVNEMQTVAMSSKNFEQQVGTINQKLTMLNSVYELQINAAQAQADAFKAQTTQVNGLNEAIQKIQSTTAEAATAGEEYKAATKQLTKQVVDLNKIYGNMLTALK
ncbi:MAG: gliding motility protein GldL [Paludibacteraceae bacterium]|nr:gliding motility protein GldL [Paludibacteraceae bacterium]